MNRFSSLSPRSCRTDFQHKKADASLATSQRTLDRPLAKGGAEPVRAHEPPLLTPVQQIDDLDRVARKAGRMKLRVFAEVARFLEGRPAVGLPGCQLGDNPWTMLRPGLDNDRLRPWGQDWLATAGHRGQPAVREFLKVALIALALEPPAPKSPEPEKTEPPVLSERQTLVLGWLKDLPRPAQAMLRRLIGSCSQEGLKRKYGNAGVKLYEEYHFTAVHFVGWGYGRTPPLQDALALLARQKPLSDGAVRWLLDMDEDEASTGWEALFSTARPETLVARFGEELCYFISRFTGTPHLAVDLFCQAMLDKTWAGPRGKGSRLSALLLPFFSRQHLCSQIMGCLRDARSPEKAFGYMAVLALMEPVMCLRHVDGVQGDGSLLRRWMAEKHELPPGFAARLLQVLCRRLEAIRENGGSRSSSDSASLDDSQDSDDSCHWREVDLVARARQALDALQRGTGLHTLWRDSEEYTRLTAFGRLEFDMLKLALAAMSKGVAKVHEVLQVALWELRTQLLDAPPSEREGIIRRYRKMMDVQRKWVAAAPR